MELFSQNRKPLALHVHIFLKIGDGLGIDGSTAFAHVCQTLMLANSSNILS
jgi:hypothetical protein